MKGKKDARKVLKLESNQGRCNYIIRLFVLKCFSDLKKSANVLIVQTTNEKSTIKKEEKGTTRAIKSKN